MYFSIFAAGLFALGTAIASPVLDKRTARSTPPTGCLIVSTAPASGQYSSLNAAITALGSGSSTTTACIFVYAGTYTVGTDQIYINYAGNLTLYGQTTDIGTYKSNVATFQRSMTSTAAGNLDASATLNVVSANFRAYNLNFKNTYGSGTQAVAVTANGNQQGFYGVGFYGYQDTLYAKAGAQYYSNCYIEGAVDYIFGAAAAWFGECTIASNGGGAITANSRSTADSTMVVWVFKSAPARSRTEINCCAHGSQRLDRGVFILVRNHSTWYVIDSSTITEASGYSLAGKVYLGRPWRVLARVIFQKSTLTEIVAAAGWTTLAADATPIFEEYGNTGDGSSTTSRVYETTATAAVTKSQLWGSSSWETWTDTSF